MPTDKIVKTNPKTMGKYLTNSTPVLNKEEISEKRKRSPPSVDTPPPKKMTDPAKNFSAEAANSVDSSIVPKTPAINTDLTNLERRMCTAVETSINKVLNIESLAAEDPQQPIRDFAIVTTLLW